jgi:hypothetical protein
MDQHQGTGASSIAGLATKICAVQKKWWLATGEGSLSPAKQEEEGLDGVFKRLRRNGHQLEKGCCEKLSSDCHSKRQRFDLIDGSYRVRPETLLGPQIAAHGSKPQKAPERQSGFDFD